jgi:hypothetical protein
MIHVVAMKCLVVPFTILVGLPLWMYIELYWAILSFYKGDEVGDLKTEESESEVLCIATDGGLKIEESELKVLRTDSTVLQ